MSTALDLAALAAQGELKIPIARGVVSEGGTGTDYTGWSGVSSVFVEAKVEVREQSRGFATLTLTVEGSSNGSVWSTLETFTFGHGGTQTATVSSPPDHLRVSWAVGGHSEWQIIEVTAAPSIIDTGGGGGSQPSLPLDLGPGVYQISETGEVRQVASDATVDDLSVIEIPATYVGDSSFGNLFRVGFDAADPSSFVLRVGLGVIDYTAAAGEGAAQINLKSADLPSDGAVLSSSDLSLHSDSPTIVVQKNDGETVFKASPNGFIFRAIAAPFDNALDPGDCSLWFDQTNGASKLKIKGKSADGTVVTGEVVLA